MTAPDKLRAALASDAEPAVALMRLLLAGEPAARLPERLRAQGGARAAALANLADEAACGLRLLERLVAAGAEHGPSSVSASRAMFDRLVQVSPEASVAAYCLGDPRRLDAATAEVVGWLDGLGLLAATCTVLDLGCGIGRFAAALSPHVQHVVGTEISAGMLAVAQARCAGLPNVGLVQDTGHDLAAFRDASFGLVLAADVFPYLVQAGATLAAAHLRECARVLRPGGDLLLLNYSYRGVDVDRRDIAAVAGFEVLANGEAPFRLWDAHAFRLRRVTA